MSERAERLRYIMYSAFVNAVEQNAFDDQATLRAIVEELGVTAEAAKSVAWMCQGQPWADALATLLEAAGES